MLYSTLDNYCWTGVSLGNNNVEFAFFYSFQISKSGTKGRLKRLVT